MPYVTRIRSLFPQDHLPLLVDLDVDLTTDAGAKPRHLIVTGPNGSGKTSLLEAVMHDVHENVVNPDNTTTQVIERLHGAERLIESGGLKDEDVQRLRVSLDDHKREAAHRFVELTWDQGRNAVKVAFDQGLFSCAYLAPQRQAQFSSVSAVTTPRVGAIPPSSTSYQQFTQLLLNRKAEESFANTDGDADLAKEIEGWFDAIQRGLRRIFQDDRLELIFGRRTFAFELRLSSGVSMDLTKLAHGHAAALSLIAELAIRADAIARMEASTGSSWNLPAVLIIDEVENHLHVSLQEILLPTLLEAFPATQLIIATHSPVIVSSIDDALIVDLQSGRQIRSETIRGTPYGDLMRLQLGLPTDIDLASTKKLEQLRELAKRGDDAEEQIRELIVSLASSPSLAIAAWSILGHTRWVKLGLALPEEPDGEVDE